MNNKYRETNTTISAINYHLVFCPHYRRKIFSIAGVEARFKELVTQICEQKKYDIISLECNIDHCHLFVNVSPSTSAHDVIKDIKVATSSVLRKEFKELSQMRVLWTRNFLASTAETMSPEIIKKYVEAQRKR